ncbi:MATE family efflux transporter [Ruegeria pomeroyi]|uniref:DNA-damage-inducible protein F n=2 Tax=Ruegeria pomeroyi TaxID=89184 RepID=Q5LPD9_RUEPO|nr:MATE family efflux transporter [Ruegeria pomeroyi]AAV96150.1 DNA-damage-inducible protein F [Ruegeria pomeroyi DSS-3]NVK97349.1 MATE family efflux transporter [Ruegeria pomeroyi]NVL00705.1 MATE family efflux transporter [Ruegeria pomeroyi]QWV09701.1 MATE family efflux transporter [Ruegeria pomeroyi]
MSDAAPITHQRVLKIAVPIMLANMTVPILGAVDTAVVGQIPQAAPIAAVGVGAIILSAIYWIFGFLRMGTAGLTAQAHGAGHEGEVAALLTRSLMIGVAGGVALILLQLPIYWGALAVSPASAEVETLARGYMSIRIWSAPAAIAIYGITGWLIALERTRAVLVLQLWMNGLNMGLDLWFVLGLGWGVNGVAFATFLAEWTGLAFGLWLCRDAFLNPRWRDWARVFEAARLRRMAVVNTDILIRSMLLQAIFVSFLLLGGRFGDVTLAANQVLLQFVHITGYALDGFAFAAESLVGQAFGAGAVARLRRAAWMTSLWGLVLALLLAVVFWALGPWLIDVMTKDPAVQLAARDYLAWMVAAPLLILALVMFDGIFIGATRSADMRNMMALSAAIYFATVWLLIEPYGNHGLWMALTISFIARGITLGLRYPALERAAVSPAG